MDYAINANPLVPGNTGQRYFYTDQTYVIRWNRQCAGRTDPTPLFSNISLPGPARALEMYFAGATPATLGE